MFTGFYIRNFKSLVDFRIALSPLTTIVGDNAVGKSTFLQAFDFMLKSVEEDFDVVLERRGLHYNDILSKYTEDKEVFLECESVVPIEDKEENIRWSIRLAFEDSSAKTVLLEECVKDIDAGDILLDYVAGKRFMVKQGKTQAIIPGVKSYSSAMKLIDILNVDNRLKTLMTNVKNTKIFDVLEPRKLTTSYDKTYKNYFNENLPALIKNMNSAQKSLFAEGIGYILSDRFKDVEVYMDSDKKALLAKVKEKDGSREIDISSNEMSYGIVRLFSIISIICSNTNNSIIAFDEIENGINHISARPLIEFLYGSVKNNGVQLIFSTQSEYFIDFINKYDIVYFYRSKNEGTKAVRLFEIPEIDAKTEYMYPGEVLLNLNPTELERIIEDAGKKE